MKTIETTEQQDHTNRWRTDRDFLIQLFTLSGATHQTALDATFRIPPANARMLVKEIEAANTTAHLSREEGGKR